MSDTIAIGNLQPGDVLLHKGTSFISKAIQFFDGTDMSHASLYLGERQVGEAIAEGLKQRDIDTAMHGNDWVKAYRLKDTPANMTPVLQAATAYLDQDNRYGYEQLLLLAFLCLTRKLKITPSLRLLVRTALDAAANILTRLISQNREPMICSEFVFRAYDEALPEVEDPYSLRLGAFMASMLPAMMGLPGGAPATVSPAGMPRGQGIHPQSLLAFLSSDSSAIWVQRAAGPEYAMAEDIDLEETVGEIEETIAGYLGEIQSAPGTFATEAPAVTLEELHAATDRFANSLFAAAQSETGADFSAAGAFAGISPARSYLIAAAADFVTPADLYRSPSLYLLGQIVD